MTETSGLLAALSAALLFASLAAWLKLTGRVFPQRLDGRPAERGQEVENASRLLALALGVSAIAAVLGLIAMMLR